MDFIATGNTGEYLLSHKLPLKIIFHYYSEIRFSHPQKRANSKCAYGQLSWIR
jgi:hypothetical protein